MMISHLIQCKLCNNKMIVIEEGNGRPRALLCHDCCSDAQNKEAEPSL